MADKEPKKRGRGRPKGSGKPLKSTIVLKQMIDAALYKVGGVDYLARQAEENPVAFMNLIAKTMPKNINVDIKDNRNVSDMIIAARKSVKTLQHDDAVDAEFTTIEHDDTRAE